MNGFPIKNAPLVRPQASKLFNHVKLNRIEEAEALILEDRMICFEFDYFKQTVYHWAAKRGYVKMLLMLLKYFKYINTFDMQNRTPLHLAVQNENKECVEILCGEGANPFHKSKDGQNALEAGIETKNVDIMNVLSTYTMVVK